MQQHRDSKSGRYAQLKNGTPSSFTSQSKRIQPKDLIYLFYFNESSSI